MSDITLLRPGFLWLALLVIPLVFLTARRLVGLAPWRRRTAILLQTLSALLLLVTLAEPALVKADQAFSLVVVLDSSASVSSQGRQQAAAYAQGVIAKADPANHTYFVAAATQARLLSNDEIASGSWLTETIQNPKSGYPMGDQNTQTDLAAGLNLADSLLPNAGKRRVVLVSDGWQTHGDAAAEASRMAARGVDVQVVGLSALGSPEVILKSLDIASYARVGDTVVSELRIYSTTETSATVNLKVDGKPFTDGRINLDPGDNRITIEQQVEAPGFHRLDATLESSSDTSAENNAASATLVVKQQPTVLVLEDRPGEADQIAKALTDRQITVEVQEPSVIPAQWAELDRYDAVVLNNVAATSFTLDQQRTLQEYVRKGGHGLITVGGQTSYAKGGYPDSVLEDILPVSSRPGPRPEQGETALILVMDRSQSMDEWMGMSREDTKFSMAKEAARLAVDSLRKDDTLGVLAFDTDNSWAVPVQKIADSTDQENIKSLITNIPLGGGTHIFPALQDAANAMRAVQANSKHIVLLTDGKDFHSETYDFVLNQLRSDNVSLSTIGVGDDADRDLLTRLAKEGQGRYYFTERIDNIPKIVFKELDLALKQSVIEGTIQPHIDAPSPLLRGFAPQDIPQLGGYDLTTPKEDSIVGLTSDLGHPLLAHWNYGLGRVASFTSDAGPGWAKQWLTWDEFARFWDQTVRWTMSSPVSHQIQPSVTVTEQASPASGEYEAVAHLSVESLNPDNSFADLADMSAAVRSPSGVVTTTLLSQTAPGRYEANVPISEPGAYEARFTRQGDEPVTETSGFSAPAGSEWLNAGTNDSLLKRLSGGRDYLAQPEQARDSSALQGVSPNLQPIWSYFLWPALILLLCSVAVRRLEFRLRRRH